MASPQPTNLEVGTSLPAFDLDLTYTMVVAGAIASRDFMPAHHEAEFAKGQGAPDIFLNILTTNGYVARYITDWAGPEAIVKKIAIRLGAPAIPKKTLSFNGEILSVAEEGDEKVIELSVRAFTDLGDHATGTVVVTLPL